MRKLAPIMALGMIGALLAVVGPASAKSDQNAQILFVSNRADGARELYVVNRDGTGVKRLTFNDLVELRPVWSPNNSKIAFSAVAPDGNLDIYTINADGSALTRVTTDPGIDHVPVWTADGSQLVYQHGFDCPCEIRIVNLDGTGDRKLDTGPGNALWPDTSRHGDKIAFGSDRSGVFAIYTMHLNGKALKQVTNPVGLGFGDLVPRWSPSGNDIAFLRDKTGTDNDLYRMKANGEDITQLVNTPNRIEGYFTWSPSGDEIVFAARGHLFAVPAAGGTETALSTWPRAPVVETFDGGRLDSSLWHQIQDPGSTIGEDDGRLVASISGNATPGGQYNQIDAHWGSQCQVAGNFDYQVDYSLVTWPAHSGYFAALNAFFADGAVARTSQPWDYPYDENYAAWANTAPFSFNSVHTNDTSGSLRLVRSEGTLNAYVRSPGGTWTLVLSTRGVTGSTVYGMGLSVQAWDFAHLDGSVAYDNFRLNSGELSCPDWWRDFAPDWRAH